MDGHYAWARTYPLIQIGIRENVMMTRNRRLVSATLIFMLLTTGCATLTTASHFTGESPKIYSGTRLDIHTSANHENILQGYKDKYGVEPPAYPKLDLPFSLLLDTIILVPLVLPVVLYHAAFDWLRCFDFLRQADFPERTKNTHCASSDTKEADSYLWRLEQTTSCSFW